MTKFKVTSSPHILSSVNKTRIMWLVIIALLPAAISGIYNFGLRVLWIMLAGVITAALTEILFDYIGKRKFSVYHGSAVVTGLLVGLIVPPTVPLWVPILGSFFGLAIAKHAFGGAGMAMFNPALVGRAFLVVSFPVLMSRYIWPDGVTSATPMTMLKLEGYSSAINYFGSKLLAYKALLFGNTAGVIGETSALALLIGGLILIIAGVIDWKIPLVYISTVFVLMFAAGQDPIYHILGGGLFLGAFFMATGYEGMPITKLGRIYFALGLGILTTLIRLFGGYPEGVTYSILLMNAATPLIERLTISKPFGWNKKDGKK